MTRLFPRLPLAIAKKLAKDRGRSTVREAQQLSSCGHRSSTFAAVGGQRVSDTELESFADQIRKLAQTHGYPDKPRMDGVATFEARCAAFLHAKAGITPTEGAQEATWAFLACVLLPDIVIWRWGGDPTPMDRFLGGERGLRNTFGRLWWRAHLLADDWWAERDRYELLHLLTEDQIVGFVERPRAFQSRLVAVAIAREVLAVRATTGSRAREIELMRDVTKRFLRRGTLIAYEALDPEEMRSLAHGMVHESLSRLGRAEFTRDRTFDVDTYGRGRSSGPAGILPIVVDALSKLDLSSKSPTRFRSLGRLIARNMSLDSDAVGVKYIGEEKNAANRVGEALRSKPDLLVLLTEGLTVDAVTRAVRARSSASTFTSFVLLSRRRDFGGSWFCARILVGANGIDAHTLACAFPTAATGAIEHIDVDGRRKIERAVLLQFRQALRVGSSRPEDVVRQVASENELIGLELRTKRINGANNVGNRISEGLGAGAEVLLLIAKPDCRRLVISEVQRQLDGNSTPPAVVILTEQNDGRLGDPEVFGLDPHGEEPARSSLGHP